MHVCTLVIGDWELDIHVVLSQNVHVLIFNVGNLVYMLIVLSAIVHVLIFNVFVKVLQWNL